MRMTETCDMRPFFRALQQKSFAQCLHPYSTSLAGQGKAVPVLNYAPRHEDLLGEYTYSSIYS